MSAYRPYPKYKVSGVEWLGEVPEGWEVTKLKFTAAITPSNIDKKSYDDELPISLCNYTDVYYNETITTEIEFMAATATRDQIRKFSLKKHDVIITKDSEDPNDIAVPSLVAETMDSVVCAYHLTLLRPTKCTDGRFLKRYFDSKTTRAYFSTRANGLTRYGLGSYPLSNADIALPPLPEQHQIAAFLDRECGKLDALQAKQERLIELLKEKRQALISHAVTRGLDPAAKLKPSGIEWLGEVPKHWEVTRLKFQVSRFEQGWSPQCEGRNKEDGEIGVLKVGCVNGGTFRVEEHKALPPELEPRLQYTLKRGDLLISRANTRELVGSAAVVDRDHDDILLCDKLYRLRFHRGVSEIYLSHFLGTSEVRQQIELDASGASASMVNIGQDCIKELNLALPPLAEQRAIVAHLDEKCRKIDQLKAKAERGIELLKERRSALISAAVTGKIDVRERLKQAVPA
ncbi:restriction endonuclease subunit S [bacterium]|nr:restriction endonuclease subunit S [bacterium]